MGGGLSVSGSASSTASSRSSGGQFDAQGKYSFGGINTGSSTQSYVAMGLVAVVAIAALILVMKR